MPKTNLKALRQKSADIHQELKGLNEKAQKAVLDANAPKLTDEERAKITALKAQFDEVEAARLEAERLNEIDRTLNVADTNTADAEAARRGAVGANLVVGESAEEKAMKRPGFFGEALLAVRRAAVHDPLAGDQQLLKLMAVGPTGMNSDVPSDGGFAIAPNWSNQIITRAYDTGAILGLVDRLTITQGNGMNLPAVDETSRADNSRYGGVVSGWLGQGVTLTSGKPKLRLMELKLRKVGAFVYATDELIADAAALQTWIERYLPLELQFRTEDAIVNGDGSNKPQGILNAGSKVSVTRKTASRVLYEDVSGMWARMWAPARRGAIWMVDQSVEQQLEQMSVSIGTAGVLAPVYKPAGVSFGPDGTQGYSPATLYGRPILTTEYGAALGTEGDIVLWAPQEYQVIDKGTVDQMVSLHVAFLTDEAVWRFIYRVDGQSKWHSALTPKSAGSTLSNVVTLV